MHGLALTWEASFFSSVSHLCEVLPLEQWRGRKGEAQPRRSGAFLGEAGGQNTSRTQSFPDAECALPSYVSRTVVQRPGDWRGLERADASPVRAGSSQPFPPSLRPHTPRRAPEVYQAPHTHHRFPPAPGASDPGSPAAASEPPSESPSPAALPPRLPACPPGAAAPTAFQV